MEKTAVKLTEEDLYDFRYNITGETHDDIYHVGDEIRAKIDNGAVLEGKVKEIFRSKRRGIYQLKLESGWCAHPKTDDVIITKPYEREAQTT